MLKTEQLFGLDFVADAGVEQVADQVISGRLPHAWTMVVTPNVDHLVRYHSMPSERAVAERADLVLPDGAPVVWASRLLRAPLRGRLTGADLFCELFPRFAREGIAVVAVVATDEIGQRLRHQHPLTSVFVPPFFDEDDDAAVDEVVDEIIERTIGTGAKFVVLGVSMPKHHRLADRIGTRRLPPGCEYPTLLLLGASADFYTGVRRRAPQWMQRAGLEWLHRLASDPRRMAKRYLVDDLRFAPITVRELLNRRAPRLRVSSR